ncbi:MAG: hypothetical protein QM479_11445 [Pseudomonadota bacterium]
MKKFMLSTAITALFVFQVANLQEARAELLYPVKIAYQSMKVRISKIQIQYDDKQLILSGFIKRRSYNSRVLTGHIYYSIMDNKGQLIKKGRTNYSSGLSLKRWEHGSHFSFVLPENMPEESSIKLGWQRNIKSTAL